jgi:tRNA(Ile)-lysidine synthetase-like protein
MDPITLPPSRYVIAVSGGVDSVVLLHLLTQKKAAATHTVSRRFVVAHFDHGIRPDSHDDRLFVQQLAASYTLPFVFDEGRLGPAASEAKAREARYNFLEKVRSASGAAAIITAHHEDDVLETAILNLLRGSGRKGLTSLESTGRLYRPLLGVPKAAIIGYAGAHNLDWREDATNDDISYRRNYIRHRVVARFGPGERERLKTIVVQQRDINRRLDHAITNLLHMQTEGGKLDRADFIQLPHPLAKEVLAVWLRAHDVRDFTTKTLERITVAAKTARSGKTIDVVQGVSLAVSKTSLALIGAER